jgi:hypothetical protein
MHSDKKMKKMNGTAKIVDVPGKQSVVECIVLCEELDIHCLPIFDSNRKIVDCFCFDDLEVCFDI